MVTTDTLIWFVLACTVAVCVVSMLGVMSSVMRHQTQLHDLRSRVAQLQYSYTLQLARLHGHLDGIGAQEGEVGEVDILDDTGAVVTADELRPADAGGARRAA